jgi:hypothetical protein
MPKELSTEVENENFELSEVHEEYIRIYHEYFVLKWNWVELCKHHNCSKMKISIALRWVIENRLNVPSEHLVNGAIDSVQERLKLNIMLLGAEISKQRFRDNNFIIALNKEIREDENTIYKLQSLIKEDNKDDEKLSASQTLNLIKAAVAKQQEICESESLEEVKEDAL